MLCGQRMLITLQVPPLVPPPHVFKIVKSSAMCAPAPMSFTASDMNPAEALQYSKIAPL